MAARLTLRLAICAALVAVTWIVFGQTLGHGFVNYDDNKYVYENENITHGVSVSGLKWAFTHFDKDNWHPLTSISHMIDCQLFDLKPVGHHFTNVLLHTIAVVLLFLVLNSLTNALWPSAFVAALFAIHPLHVESVAWIAERKDVLSAVFFMLTLGAYARYARQPTIGRYLILSILLECGLMSKAMLVTMPLVLLLLDYWPLHRGLAFAKATAGRQASEVKGQKSVTVAWLIAEKVPLLVLSLISSVATLLAQKNWEIRLEAFPLSWRVANAVSACVIYLRQMIWPVKLAVIYPQQDGISIWQSAGAAALLLAITIAIFLVRRKSPYLLVGWLWYLVMLVPVLGFIKVGGLAHADRYTYLPQIGLYVAATWGIVDLAKSMMARREVIAAGAAIIVIALALCARAQASYWYSGETLWRHTLATTAKNDLAHFILADFLAQHQRVDEAVSEYQAGLRIDPKNADAETSLANLLLQAERGEEALLHYQNAMRLEPGSALAHYNLAVGLHRQGRLEEAIAHYKEALRIQPGYPDAEDLLRQALQESGQQ